MSTPRVVRRATWRELRELVTTANGRTFRSTSTSPTCIGLATAVTLLRPWGTSRCCTSELLARLCHFRLLRNATLGPRALSEQFHSILWGVRVWVPLWTSFSGTRGAFWWGRGQWRSVLFAWVFGRAHELAMDFHRHQQSQLFGLYMAMSLEQFDSATALSKETSDENLYGVEADAVEAQVASVREDGLTHFICLTFDIIVWMFSCTRQFSMCPCVELGCCTHDIERALSRTARAPLCRLTASGGFISARKRIRWSFTCLVRVSVIATRPCSPRTRHHCNRRTRGCKLRVFVRTDGLTPCICSYLNILLWKCSRLHAPTLICPYGMYQSGTRTSLSSDMMTPHLFRKNVHLQFQCLGQLLGGRSIIGTVTRFLKNGTTES